MPWMLVVTLGFGVGILVGLMGVGGGIVLVPALVYLTGMDQHLAQGTSLFLQLPPIGLGALHIYRRNGNVDLRAGFVCALGFLLGGYSGSLLAIGLASQRLRLLFGIFLMLSAAMLARQALAAEPSKENSGA
ncbi:MAG: sulfite exporter TauE/SafE family protein [Acidobacteria bacterium]|nr:sulfite exporter TauE/SafE family protein [Acidobacteriota bacterium]